MHYHMFMSRMSHAKRLFSAHIGKLPHAGGPPRNKKIRNKKRKEKKRKEKERKRERKRKKRKKRKKIN